MDDKINDSPQSSWIGFERNLLPRLLDTDLSILFFDRRGLFLANDYFIKEFGFIGLAPGEIEKKLFPDPGESARFNSLLASCFDGDRAMMGELKMQNGFSVSLSVRVHLRRLDFVDHDPVCSCGVYRDFTPAPVVRLLEREGADIFQLIAEHSLNGIALASDGGESLYINPAGMKILGIRDEESRKVSLFSFIHPESMRQLMERQREWFERKAARAEKSMYKIIRADGAVRELEVVNTTIYRQGKSCRLSTFVDVTDRLATERELKASEERLRIIADNVKDVIWTTDDSLKVTYASPSVENIFGYSPGEVVGTGFEKVVPPHVYEPAISMTRKIMEEYSHGKKEPEGGFNMEAEFTHKDGHKVFTESRWVFLHDEDGRVVGTQGVTRDITQRKKTEAELAEARTRLEKALREEVRRLRRREYGKNVEIHLQYSSPAMRALRREAELAADSDGNLLLLGESGSGKNYLAGWVHERSRRAEGPFFEVNCASLPPSLIEAELFGHEAGAFTGSTGFRRGLLELADGGTLFLDEIGDMDHLLQSRLLQFLDTRRVRRVGGEESIAVDARVIAATNRDIRRLVNDGRFREDLYYRLYVLSIRLPSLRERSEDIPVLVAEIMGRLAREMGLHDQPALSEGAIEILKAHDWPGNVRELRNVLERLVLGSGGKSSPDDASRLEDILGTRSIKIPTPYGPGGELGFKRATEAFERQLVEKAFERGGTRQDVARILGISRHALLRVMRRLGMDSRKLGKSSKAKGRKKPQ